MNDPALVSAAQRTTREEFAAAHPWPFLVGEPSLHVPRTAMRTLAGFAPALRKLDTMMPDAEPPAEPSPQLLVLAVRKRQDVFAEMITVGRTANHDLVINDATVSKFHAYFRQLEDRWELLDAGSRNGTKVNGRPLVPKQPAIVLPGARVRFGTIDLTFRTAREAWDALRGA